MNKDFLEYITVIIPAAGQGKRMGKGVNKQYLKINNKPIIVHTIEKFINSGLINDIIVVISKEEIEYFKKEIIQKYNLSKNLNIVEGGKERQESVYNGLKNISSKTDIVLIHDGARPFVSIEEIKKSIEGAKQYGSCVIAVKVKDTIKVSDEDGYIKNTPNRENLWSVQTPQAFKKHIIIKAYNKAEQDNFLGTDDAMLVERIGQKVKIIEGKYDNIKITTPHDLYIGEIIIKSRKQNNNN
ncbi:2-C-methyl-D-erythritol 4-phosphate cytidylyltransferase [Defluviitalea phaphyphila]|uniref:2-C-methyl-D-erythritol 4-phosphate cytidylyltransferase n=1 Tax=Defluviitalea phaphyphila TaxID=1473580 RepID=UPI0007310015|nr:2-C-methyl-D-erythritol 4-phosphate cytidylyltransferase [Defluviitalea phaphyphila]